MENSHTFLTLSYRLGNWLILFCKLQFFWLVLVLQGGVIFGIFPATATVMQFFLIKWTSNEQTQSLYLWFKHTTKKNYRMVNYLGYFYSGIVCFLWLDLKISQHLIQNQLLHICLIIMLSVVTVAGFYLFPVFLRYHLSLRQYFLRTLLLLVISPFQMIAMVLSIFLTSILLTILPILLFIASIPLFLFPISYFAYQGIQKAENLYIK